MVKEVDHEAERIERLREEGRGKKLKANELVGLLFLSSALQREIWSWVERMYPADIRVFLFFPMLEQKNAQLEEARRYAEAKSAKSYSELFTEENGYTDQPRAKSKKAPREDDDEDGEAEGSGGDDGSDDDFW